jgi:hypothetical protein
MEKLQNAGCGDYSERYYRQYCDALLPMGTRFYRGQSQ